MNSKFGDNRMEITILRGDTKHRSKVVLCLWDPHSSIFDSKYFYYIYTYTKFGENRIEITTFMRFMNFGGE